MSDIAQESASTLLQLFAEAASSVLSQIAGTALHARPMPLEEAIPAATLVRIEITGALSGLCEVALSAPMTASFSALLTGETPDPAAEVTADQREAAAELIQQICGNLADRLRHVFGPLELKPRPTDVRDPKNGSRRLFLINREDDALEIEVRILHLGSETRASETTTAAMPNASPHSATTQPAALPGLSAVQSGNRNLDLLLDIELGVTLRFGTRQMLLKDIIELCSGSVVELDRHVQEPVDLLIADRLIAQGEVVIVEGNYGLRITNVASQGEKVACLP